MAIGTYEQYKQRLLSMKPNVYLNGKKVDRSNGKEGAERIGRIMTVFREKKPDVFGPHRVKERVDYFHGYKDIPASNVLKLTMEDGCWFAMRPSGTEPKIKFYYYAESDNMERSLSQVREMRDAVNAMIDSIA